VEEVEEDYGEVHRQSVEAVEVSLMRLNDDGNVAGKTSAELDYAVDDTEL
jgi:hypothetical protein